MEGILAIDPAGPVFEANSDTTKLSKNDAKAVQVFHTNSNGMFTLGHDPQCGTVDFYFNGAKQQPGCKDILDTCSHNYGNLFLIALNNRGSYRDMKRYFLMISGDHG